MNKRSVYTLGAVSWALIGAVVYLAYYRYPQSIVVSVSFAGAVVSAVFTWAYLKRGMKRRRDV